MIPLSRASSVGVDENPTGQTGAVRPSWPVRHPLATIALLWTVQTGMNLAWRLANVTVVGWDRPAHLLRALDYLRTLQPFGLEGLMNVLTGPGFYPPFYHLSVAGFFALFGTSADSGAMANAIFMAVLLISVYGIGELMFDRVTGLLAATLVSFFPIVFNLSRFTYIEFSLTALVALNVCCLLRSRGFRDRRWSLAFGLTFGLGLLSKWVFVAFAAVPLLYVLATSSVLQLALADLKRAVRQPRVDVWRLLGCGAIGCAASAAWFLASGDWEAKSQIGATLGLVYAIAATVLLYLAGRPSGRGTNLLAATVLAAGVAAAWYLPNINFLGTGLFKAYHLGSETGGAFDSGGVVPALVLLRGTVAEDLSAPVAIAGMALFVAWLVKRRGILPFSAAAQLLTLWFLVPFAFFASFSNETSWNMRLTAPILLPVGLVLARLTLAAAKRWRILPAAMVLLVGVQWLVLSLDVFAALPPKLSLDVPSWGRLGWFAGGEFAQWPSTGPTDEDFHIAPPIFRAILTERQAGSSGPVSLGLLVNQSYLNGYRAAFLAEHAFPDVEVVDLYRDRAGIPVYPDLFRLDYLLVSDSGVRPLEDGDEATRVVTSILKHPTDDFKAAFREVRTFEIPNGDRLHLFANHLYRPPHSVPAELMPRSAGTVVNLQFGDALLLASYDLDMADIQNGRLQIELLWVALEKMTDDYRMTLKLLDGMFHEWARQEGHPGYGSYLTTAWEAGQVVRDRREIIVPLGTPPGSYAIELSAYGVHDELELRVKDATTAVLSQIELPRRTGLTESDLEMVHRASAQFGDGIRMLGYDAPDAARPGETIPLTMYWEALQPAVRDYTFFAHLVDGQGKPWGQKDNQPANGFYPTSHWSSGEIVRDPYAIPVDAGAPDGEYYLHVGLYLADSGERLPVTTGQGATPADKYVIGPIRVGRR